MTYPTDTNTIRNLFYKQVTEMTRNTAKESLDAFNYQFSGRCFL